MHRYGEVQYHEREYDLRDGVLRRSVRWTSPTGRAVKVSSVRMVSFTQRAAEVGQLQLAYDYLGEAALLDLDDLEHNVRDGGHLAALAGTWTALVAGFGSPRSHDGSLSFAPRLPEGIVRLAFHLLFAVAACASR